MPVSRPLVHPLEVLTEVPEEEQAAEEPQAQGVLQPPQGVLMKDVPGVPGTPVALGLRVTQLLFAGIALAVMISTSDFTTVPAFCALVAAVILQSLYSVMLAIVDIYALMVKRHLHNPRAVGFIAAGDLIVGGITFAAACASAGVTMLMTDLSMCDKEQCPDFTSAIAMMFFSGCSVAPTCVLNLLLAF